MSGTFNKRGSFLFWVRVGKRDVAIYLDKEAVQELAEKATTHVKRISVKGPIMCHASKGRVRGFDTRRSL